MRSTWAVIPAQNEEPRITSAIDSAWAAGVKEVLVVNNGSLDDTEGTALAHPRPPRLLTFPMPLGPDIPRAVGAHIACQERAEGVLFLDGDMTGVLGPFLCQLLAAIQQQFALALTDPFPHGPPVRGLAGEVMVFRQRLNHTLSWTQLGASIMSHGPSAVSREFLLSVGCRALGHPPVAMAHAAKLGLRATIGCTMQHEAMGGAGRDAHHATKMAETIIGDCLEAISVFRSCPPRRCWRGKHFDGYNSARRWAWLENWLHNYRGGPSAAI